MPAPEVLTPVGQAFLGMLAIIAVGAFGYLIGRIGALEEDTADLADTLKDLYQRVYGRQHDKGDPGGLIVEVQSEFKRLHRRLDGLSRRIEHDRRERRRDRRKIKRRLEGMSNGDLEDVMGFGDDEDDHYHHRIDGFEGEGYDDMDEHTE